MQIQINNSPIFKLLSVILILLLVIGNFSCEKEVEIPNEEELITNVDLILTSEDGTKTVTLSFEDLDGDGGNAPIINTVTLENNTIYFAELSLKNTLEDPAEDISAEVLEEGLDHQVFYESSLLSVEYTDADSEGLPIGLKTKITTIGAGQSDLLVTLRHKPSKSEDGVASGSIENAGGETDVAINFQFNVD